MPLLPEAFVSDVIINSPWIKLATIDKHMFAFAFTEAAECV